MPYVYKYVDDEDGICKYVGITGGGKSALRQRIYAHKGEEWTQGRRFAITCFRCDTRSEAEAFESHFIAEYETWKYFNSSKADWGINQWLSAVDVKWKPIEDAVDFSQRTIDLLKSHRIRKQEAEVIVEEPEEISAEPPMETEEEMSPVQVMNSLEYEAECKCILEDGLRIIKIIDEDYSNVSVIYTMACNLILEWVEHLLVSIDLHHVAKMLELWGCVICAEELQRGQKFPNLYDLISWEKQFTGESLAEYTMLKVRNLCMTLDRADLDVVRADCPNKDWLYVTRAFEFAYNEIV